MILFSINFFSEWLACTAKCIILSGIARFNQRVTSAASKTFIKLKFRVLPILHFKKHNNKIYRLRVKIIQQSLVAKFYVPTIFKTQNIIYFFVNL